MLCKAGITRWRGLSPLLYLSALPVRYPQHFHYTVYIVNIKHKTLKNLRIVISRYTERTYVRGGCLADPKPLSDKELRHQVIEYRLIRFETRITAHFLIATNNTVAVWTLAKPIFATLTIYYIDTVIFCKLICNLFFCHITSKKKSGVRESNPQFAPTNRNLSTFEHLRS